MKIIFQKIASASPSLKIKLKQAGISLKPEEFVKKSFFTAAYLTIGIFFFIFLILAKFNLFNPALIVLVLIFFFMMFSYAMKLPDYKIIKEEKDISREVVFAGRFLLVEIESGVPLFDAIRNLSHNFKIIGHYAREIVNKVEFGTSLEDALNEASELNPSGDFRRILWQIINSLRTGSDIAKSLNSVVEQIAKEQMIEVSRYGKKLNPLAMFYMIIAVILPSLGITMFVILSSFIQIHITLELLLIIAGLIGFVQFMFVSLIKFSRPPIDF